MIDSDTFRFRTFRSGDSASSSRRARCSAIARILRRRLRLFRRGVVMVWVAMFLSLMVLIVGLSLDAAKVLYINHQLQNAADAAALAGAQMIRLNRSQAVQQAISTAAANFADNLPVFLRDNPDNDPTLDVVVGMYYPQNRLFTATTARCNSVKVVARRNAGMPDGPVSLNFGPVAGVESVDISRFAIALAQGGTGAGLIALTTDGTGLEMSGNVTLYVGDGDIQVNSYNPGTAPAPAFDIDGTSWSIQADQINVCGFADEHFDWENFPVPLQEEAPELPDPLCPNGTEGEGCLPEPTWNPAADRSPLNDTGERVTTVITGGTHVIEPGYYSGGFNISGGDVVFKPGIYILGGGPKQKKSGLVVSGNANLCAKGVMFYITEEGRVDLAGTGDTILSPPINPDEADEDDDLTFCDPSFSYPADMDWTYQDITFFQDRDNTQEARIIGTSLLDITGTLYFPNNHVELGGDGSSAGNQLIAHSIDVHGTGTWTVNYDGRNRGLGFYSILVE